MIVDVHAHYFPKPYIETLMRIGGRSLPEAVSESLYVTSVYLRRCRRSF